MDIMSYILSKKYTDNTVDGLGAIKGAPCTVESVVDIDGGKRITLEWEGNSGVKQTQSFDIMDGEDGANTVEWSQVQQGGTKIAEININGVSQDVYAPQGGGSGGDSWTDIEGTLLAGQTSITLNSSSIKLTSTFEFFTDVFGVCPTNAVVSTGSITLTFDAQANDLGVKVRVTNATSPIATYSHLKLQLLKTRGNPPHAGAIQSSEFYIVVNSSDYSWGNATITSNMAGSSAQQNVASLIDDNILTKYCTVAWGSVQTNECNIIITLDGSISSSDITGYAFVTGEDEPSRDPISWKLYGSSDGTNWDLIDEQTDYAVTTERRTRVNILL